MGNDRTTWQDWVIAGGVLAILVTGIATIWGNDIRRLFGSDVDKPATETETTTIEGAPPPSPSPSPSAPAPPPPPPGPAAGPF